MRAKTFRKLLQASVFICATSSVGALAQVGGSPETLGREEAARLGSGAEARTQEPGVLDGGRITMHAVALHRDEAITMDGTLSNPAWDRAPVYDEFIEHEPRKGARPAQLTQVRILYDQAAIYVGVNAVDASPEQIRAPLVRRDRVLRSQDFVGVYIDAVGKGQSSQFFRVNASGSVGDGMFTSADDDEDMSPDYDFEAASSRNDSGYTSVFRIPFSSLRFTSEADASWRIMVVRRMPREQNFLWTSVAVPLDAPSFISAMQPLAGVRLPDDRSLISIRPSVTARRSDSREEDLSHHREDGIQGSLDVKWRPLPELVVDATLKPDFSQVELDVPQLSGNTDFALYLPEKRPFFFESADLLHSPTEALYTRSFTQPRWGLRTTWRGESLAGTAFLIDDKGGGQTLLPFAYGTNTALQPGSRSVSARAHVDVDQADRVQLGAVLAARRYEQDRGDNAVFGPDFRWRITDAWNLQGQWLRSETTAQPDAAGSLSRGASAIGSSAAMKFSGRTDRAQLEVSVSDISPAFRHDTGFVNQVGVREINLHQAFVFRELSPTNELWFNLREKEIRSRTTNEVIQESIMPDTWMSLPFDSQLWAEWHGLSRVRVAQEGHLLAEHFWKGGLSTSPAPWLPTLEASVAAGRMTDFAAAAIRPGVQVNVSASIRPLASMELEPSIWTAWLRGATSLAYHETAAQLMAVWHFDARQNIRLIVQRSTERRNGEPTVAADRSSHSASSLTYAFRRSAGTVFYVGATRSRSEQSSGVTASRTEAFVKLQFEVGELSSICKLLR